MKNRTEEVAEKLKLGEVPEKPWIHISVGFITKLLMVAGKDAILVVCDRLSKMTHFIATTEGTTAEFAVNNKIHSTTKVSLFMANYGREVRIGGDIRKKGKVESAAEFVERMKKVHEEAGVALKKTQEEMKKYADRSRRETEKWKRGDRVLLSTKDLVFKERPIRKLTERYIGLYEIEEVVLSNIVKLQLPALMRIHPVVNVS